jgi:hypothetical protein
MCILIVPEKSICIFVSLFLIVQSGAGAHRTSYPMSTNVSYPGAKASWNTAGRSVPHILPEVRNVCSYISNPPPTLLHAMAQLINETQRQLYL